MKNTQGRMVKLMEIAEALRKQRVADSVKEHEHRKEHYDNFLKKRAFNIKNKIAPDSVNLDNKGYRL